MARPLLLPPLSSWIHVSGSHGFAQGHEIHMCWAFQQLSSVTDKTQPGLLFHSKKFLTGSSLGSTASTDCGDGLWNATARTTVRTVTQARSLPVRNLQSWLPHQRVCDCALIIVFAVFKGAWEHALESNDLLTTPEFSVLYHPVRYWATPYFSGISFLICGTYLISLVWGLKEIMHDF